MKKMGLFCAALLACGSLAGCGQQQHHSSKDAASISKLKAENSSLKAKKSSHHKHKRAKSSNEAEISSQTNSTKKSSAQDNHNGTNDATANKLRNMDPKYWDSLSADEKAFWISKTQASGNDTEEYLNSAGFVSNQWAQQGGMPSNSSSPSNGGNNSGYIPSNDDWHVYPDTGYTPSVPTDN